MDIDGGKLLTEHLHVFHWKKIIKKNNRNQMDFTLCKIIK